MHKMLQLLAPEMCYSEQTIDFLQLLVKIHPQIQDSSFQNQGGTEMNQNL